MKLVTNKPIAFFDLETTGTNPVKDKIVEIAILKINIDGTESWYEQRVNPGIPIPKETSAIHGIYDDDVKDMPDFKSIAKDVELFLRDCDLAGFNMKRFDLPLLMQSFVSVEIDFKINKRRLVDVQRIFHKMEPRNLTAALKFYCNEELIDSHSAKADTQATYDVFKAQLKHYSDDIPENIKDIHDFCNDNKHYDLSGRMIINEDGTISFNFGKHKGTLVSEVLKKEPQYYKWIMNNDFPPDTKNKLTEIWLKEFNKK